MVAMRVHLCGVRGSTPAPGADFVRYGGQTSCVAVARDGDRAPVLILDAGTGLRAVTGLLGDRPFDGTILLTHLHWDHVQGLPFFTPLHRPGSTLDVYGPRQDGGPLGEVFAQMMRPPFFPIVPDQLAGAVRFHDTGDDDRTGDNEKGGRKETPRAAGIESPEGDVTRFAKLADQMLGN